MKILLHICCAPCAIYPVNLLRREGHKVIGYFNNPNIHPYREWLKRAETLKEWANKEDLKVIFYEEYPLTEFLRSICFRETHRCRICYHWRLLATAKIAKKSKFDAFTSTLLYSKFQKYELISDIGSSISKEVGIEFLEIDFREGWKEGIQRSRELGLYRQEYCGCIFSEKERFYNPKKLSLNR